MPADPYTILGVSKNASAEEIKKAYRKLAHHHHPDKKGGNEQKFKEINEAYQTLSDSDKRARYDQFGHAGSGGFGGGQHHQDFNFDFGTGGFESIFDMFGAASSPRATRPEKGEDIYLDVSVSKKDLGQRKVYEFEVFGVCGICGGSGVAPGARVINCSQCKGAGHIRHAVRTPFGTFTQVVTCSICQGGGSVPEKLCSTCSGHGRFKTKRKFELHIPDGISDRHLVVFPRQGNVGPNGAPAGDLMITIRMR